MARIDGVSDNLAHTTRARERPGSGHSECVVSLLLVIVGVVVLPTVVIWLCRMHTRVVDLLVPGADFGDVTAVADFPIALASQSGLPIADGPRVHLLLVTRAAASLFIAYRPVASPEATVTTLLLDLATTSRRELAALARWQSVGTPVLVRNDPVSRRVAIQEPLTRLMVTLSMLS
jgi:hypothetical protein